LKNVVSLPEGDSLYLKKIYDLEHANTVIKGKILKKEFEQIWKLIVKLGLTDNQIKIDLQTQKSFKNYLETFLPPLPYCTIEDKLQNLFNATDLEIEKLKELGLFDESWIENDQEINASTILQFLLEKNFAFEPVDRDEVIMQHHIEYTLKGTKHNLLVTLLTKGENNMDSATAKAIGLTTAVAAKSVMLGNISLKGLHIPIKKEIYEPMLEELYHLGIHFQIEKEKVLELNLSSIIQINKQNNF
jgi:saccharopine dehydrogenase (NADP+, L-glutamate forming)